MARCTLAAQEFPRRFRKTGAAFSFAAPITRISDFAKDPGSPGHAAPSGAFVDALRYLSATAPGRLGPVMTKKE